MARQVLNAADFSFNEVNNKNSLSNEANTDNWRLVCQEKDVTTWSAFSLFGSAGLSE